MVMPGRTLALAATWLRVLVWCLIGMLVIGMLFEYLAPTLRVAVRTPQAAGPANRETSTITQVQHGAYLARLGNCAQCHTPRGAPAYAGGVAISTPFGQVYSSNLTPDNDTGIGRWTSHDFWRAMHYGQAPDGRLYNPAFPYTSFTHITRADADALFAYLRTLTPSHNPNRPHALPWHVGSQTALAAWRWLFFSPYDPVPPPTLETSSSPSAARGAYLVNGLGHCAQCHTPRNALGALQTSATWSGALMPDGRWYAPALNDPRQAGLNAWSAQDIATLLTQGQHQQAFMSGPMGEIVYNSTQFLAPEDALSMGMFLQTLVPPNPNSINNPSPVSRARPSVTGEALGATLYKNHCAQCHGKAGEGIPNAYPALAGNRAVQMHNPHNLVSIVLYGGYGPSTAGKPMPFGMPPFQLTLEDAEVAAVLSHIRSSWGNASTPVSEFDINRIRNNSP